MDNKDSLKCCFIKDTPKKEQYNLKVNALPEIIIIKIYVYC